MIKVKRRKWTIGFLMQVILIAALFFSEMRDDVWVAFASIAIIIAAFLIYGLLTGITKYFE